MQEGGGGRYISLYDTCHYNTVALRIVVYSPKARLYQEGIRL